VITRVMRMSDVYQQQHIPFSIARIFYCMACRTVAHVAHTRTGETEQAFIAVSGGFSLE